MDTTPLTIVSTEEQLLKLCELLKTQTEIAVDTEVSRDDDDVDDDDDDDDQECGLRSPYFCGTPTLWL